MHAPQIREIVPQKPGSAALADELGLIDYFAVLWRYAPLILGVTILCGVVAYLVDRSGAPVYEARVTVMVSASKLGDGPEPQVPIAMFRALLENRTIARDVIQEFGLERSPFRCTPASFVENNLSVDEIKATNYLTIRVRLSDRDLAAKVANRVVDRGIELNRRINEQDDVVTQDFMRRERDEASARMGQAADRLLEFKRSAQIELTKEDTKGLLDQRGKLLQLLVDIEAERARLARAEEELAKQPPMLTTARSRDLENTLAEVGRQTSEQGRGQAAGARVRAPDDADRWVGVELGSGVSNPVHEILQYQVASSRTKLSAMERQRRELADGLGVGGREIGKLRELHQKEAELAKHELEYELSARIYSDLATRYEQARIRVASKSAQLSMLDPALAPERPLRPRPMLQAIAVMAVGFLGVCAAVLAYACWPRAAATGPRAASL